MAREEPGRFALLLRRVRAAAGLSQEELAERAGLSRRGISDLERGERRAPHPATLRRLANALNLGLTEQAALLASGYAGSTPEPARPPFPAPLTSFIGREGEVAEVRCLLSSTRLLTLTGPGGIGKTRLALEAARSSTDVAFVDLAPHSDGALVASALAAALGINERPRVPLLELLTVTLASRSVLLLLDNCEHLVTACSELAYHLLRTCPQLRILSTSRQPLGVAGEQLWPVPPLSLAGSTGAQGADASEAVHLFAERARLVQPDFALSDRTTATLIEICWRLDGIPLAIELAAARVRVLGLKGLAARLDERLRLFSTEAHGVPVRQRTLHATISWSYELLSEQEQACFRQLSVFAGGWTLEAAERVCHGEVIGRDAGVDLLTRLVDRSLVVAEEQGGVVRYRLLDTVRKYGLEQLAASGEEEAARNRHAIFFLDFAELAERELMGSSQAAWLEKLEQETDNLRAALGSASSAAKPERGLQLAGALYAFWELRGHLSEGRRWLEALLARAESGTTPSAAVRTKALRGAGVLAWQQGDYVRARALHEEGLALARDAGDRQAIAIGLTNLGVVTRSQGEYEQATALNEESLLLARDAGNTQSIALALNNLGVLAMDQGKYEHATALLTESLSLGRNLGDTWAIALALNNLGLLANDQGEHKRSTELLEECLALRRDLGDKRGIATAMEGLAAAASAQDLPERAATLFGAAGALRESILAPQEPSERDSQDRILDGVRGCLSNESFASAWEAGRESIAGPTAALR